jgi:hypothetical protein
MAVWIKSNSRENASYTHYVRDGRAIILIARTVAFEKSAARHAARGALDPVTIRYTVTYWRPTNLERCWLRETPAPGREY